MNWWPCHGRWGSGIDNCETRGMGVVRGKRSALACAALVLVACHACTQTPQDGTWAAFNGFHPGMSLKDAQAAGARNCKERTVGAKGLDCEIPPDRLQLGPWVAKAGQLQFHAGHEHRLSRILVEFQGPHFNEVCQALAKVHGVPVQDTKYFFHRNGTPALISSLKTSILGDSRRTLVEFEFEPELAGPKYDFSLKDPRGCLDSD